MKDVINNMNKYKVEITEYLQKIIEVEAENEMDALAKIEADYKSQKIILDADDFIDKNIEIYNPNKI